MTAIGKSALLAIEIRLIFRSLKGIDAEVTLNDCSAAVQHALKG